MASFAESTELNFAWQTAFEEWTGVHATFELLEDFSLELWFVADASTKFASFAELFAVFFVVKLDGC